jgi:hypothetical protein
VEKEGETLAAMISTCMKLLLLSFQTFPKCNLRAFLTKAETSCESVVALTRKVQNVYSILSFKGLLAGMITLAQGKGQRKRDSSQF